MADEAVENDKLDAAEQAAEEPVGAGDAAVVETSDAPEPEPSARDEQDAEPETLAESETPAEPEMPAESETPVAPETPAEPEGDAKAEKGAKPKKGLKPKTDATAEHEAASEKKQAAPESEPVRRSGLPTGAWVLVCCIVLVVGVLAGHFLLGGAGQVSLAGRTTLSAGELGSTIATYTYDGQTTSVTAGEIVDASGTGANDDGTYDVPAASDVLSYVQNQIIFADAEKRGITVSDDEIASFASSVYGTDDVSTLASAYGMDEDAVRETLRQGVLVNKLAEQVMTTSLPQMPEAPTAPAEGQEDTPTADYASYVISLLGDEWDSAADTWARTDGTYYSALSGYDISNEGATYEAASAAYNVAQSAYQTASQQRNQEWSAYTSSILSNATIQLGSLAE